MKFERNNRTDEELLTIHQALVTPRLIEEKMLILLRQGKISKWFSGIGQEAISVGAALALDKEEYILPMHRNLGVFTTRGVPFQRLFSQFQGKMNGFTKGRDRSFHFGTQDYNIVGMISHLGPQLGIADGIALSHLLRKEKKVSLVFTGDGGTSEGDFHEAVNVASVWKLPVVFVIENNGYGLSTPSREQFNFDSFVVKGPAYGMEAYSVEGNSVLEVLNELEPLVEDIRKNPRPIIFEAKTFRMRGHEEASGTKYVPKELMEKWAKKDPVKGFESFLIKEGVCTNDEIGDIRKSIQKEINEAVKEAFAEETIKANTETELADVYFPHEQKVTAPKGKKSSKRFVDAISDGLRQSLEKHPELIIMGQDIADYGGVFKITEGFMEQFGKERIRNTPLCEAAIVGTGLGLSIAGMKAVVEMQFADFVTEGFNQIVNNLAKIHYRWGQNADVVVRMPTGAGVGAGPFHSQSNEAWFFHTPGLKIVYPSNPVDAKGLLAACIEDPNPYLYFEHKALYRSLTEDVPDAYFTTEVGKAVVCHEGDDLTIITYGMGVHWAMQYANQAKHSLEVVDLRTLLPWDKETVTASVRKTGRVMVLHEDCLTGGIGGEIAAWISEHCFEYLDAPVMREGSLDTPVPFAADLEKNFLPNERLEDRLISLVNY
ncbi:dehydrogenase E1 component subunit alpha/beta [Ekhidna sp.]|jgi:2-oxoisovalerate dehydrogenase E1 component|uniref:alpha-ketoacid dehydrogenase subunit alpha/beta n=1 Tax=Ekhidna sp. TaxID=2608089 RepID=UPI0032ED12BE